MTENTRAKYPVISIETRSGKRIIHTINEITTKNTKEARKQTMVKKEKERTGHYVGMVFAKNKTDGIKAAHRLLEGTKTNIELEIEYARKLPDGRYSYRVIVLDPRGK